MSVGKTPKGIPKITEYFYGANGEFLESIGDSTFKAQDNYSNLLFIHLEDGVASNEINFINFTPQNANRVYTSHWFYLHYVGITERLVNGENTPRNFATYVIPIPNLVLQNGRNSNGSSNVVNTITVIKRYGVDNLGVFNTLNGVGGLNNEHAPNETLMNENAFGYVIGETDNALNGFYQVLNTSETTTPNYEWVKRQNVMNYSLQQKQYDTRDIVVQKGYQNVANIPNVNESTTQMLMQHINNMGVIVNNLENSQVTIVGRDSKNIEMIVSQEQNDVFVKGVVIIDNDNNDLLETGDNGLFVKHDDTKADKIDTYTKEEVYNTGEVDSKNLEQDNRITANENDIATHIVDVDNPHAVTAEQVDTYNKITIDDKDSNTLQAAKDYTYSKVEIDNKDTAIMNKSNELENDKVDKTTTIIGLDLQDNILIGEFKTALGNATQSLDGLLSAEDKTHLDGLVALLETDDADSVVDTIGEILEIFENYPEGADLVTALQGKVDKIEGKGLSENDYTDIDKNKVNLSYTHSEIVDGSNPHNTKFINIADKPTTRDGYGITDVYTKPETYTQLEINNLLDNLSAAKGLKSTLLTPTELSNGNTISTNLLTNNGAYVVFTAIDTSTGEIDSDTVPISTIKTGKKFVFFDNQDIVFTIGETNSTFETSEDITLKINLLYLDNENVQAIGVDFDGSLTNYLLTQTNVQEAIEKIDNELKTTNDNSNNHTNNVNNPHSVTKTQVGLSNVDNTSDLDKPISTLTQSALNNKSNVGHTHTKIDITDFAHNHDGRYYTEEETNTLLNAKLNTSLKGSANGLAELNSDGKVPSGQLPSYVDDVLEYASFSSFPSTGESSKIYISQDTNKTYRWSGSEYIEISASLALGETSSTAGRGDWTKTAHNHTFLTNNPHGVTTAQIDAEPAFGKNTAFNKNFGTTLNTVAQGNHLHTGVYEPANSNIQSHISSESNPHNVTASQVGLGNVDNTSDLSKPISTDTQGALDNKVDKETGKGLSTNDYTTTEKNKLAGIASGAEVNVQSNWDASSGDALILNKPSIPTKASDLTNDTGYITGYTETDPIFTAWDKSTGISITKSQVSDLIEASQELSGLMSATDKQRLDVLHALLEEDTSNNVVDSINEVLEIFNNYPEGADLVTALAGKVDKVSGKGLSTNDYTNTDKNKLSGIEAGAQVNRTATQVKTAYESNANTNAFTNTEKTKLAGIEQDAEKNTVLSVAGKTGNVVLTKGNVGLGNVENKSSATIRSEITKSNIENKLTGTIDTHTHRYGDLEGLPDVYGYKNLAIPDLTGKEYLGDGVYRIFNQFSFTMDYNVMTGEFILNKIAGDGAPSTSYNIINLNGLSGYVSFEYINGSSFGEVTSRTVELNNKNDYLERAFLQRQNASNGYVNNMNYLTVAFGSTNVFNNFVFRLQIEQGTTSTPYQIPLEPIIYHTIQKYI